jgi:hypothetical protein
LCLVFEQRLVARKFRDGVIHALLVLVNLCQRSKIPIIFVLSNL